MKFLLSCFILFWIGLMILIHWPIPDEVKGDKEMTALYGEDWRDEMARSMKTNKPHFIEMRTKYRSVIFE